MKKDCKKMSLGIVLLSMLCLLVNMPLSASARQGVSREAKGGDTLNIVYIGNSITFGATLADAEAQCPPRRVAEMLQGRGYTVDYRNCAVSGYTTFHFIPSGSQHGAVVSALKQLDGNPGRLLVLIMLGTNDSAEQGTLGAPVSTDTYYQNMKAIIDDIYKVSPRAEVIVNYPIWYSPNTHNFSTYLQAGLDRLGSYYPVIDKLVKYYNRHTAHRVYAGSKAPYVFFKDQHLKYQTPEEGRDGTFYLHPNEAGARKLATFWANSILKIVGGKAINDADLKPYFHKKPRLR